MSEQYQHDHINETRVPALRHLHLFADGLHSHHISNRLEAYI